jgi:hypothetical protein
MLMMKRPSNPRTPVRLEIAALHHDHRVGVGIGRHLGRSRCAPAGNS